MDSSLNPSGGLRSSDGVSGGQITSCLLRKAPYVQGLLRTTICISYDCVLCRLLYLLFEGPCPLNRFVTRPSFLTGVVGQSQPSVGREELTVSAGRLAKKPTSTKSIFLAYTSVSRLT